MKTDTFLHLIFGFFALILMWLESTLSMQNKIIITVLIVIAVLIALFKEKLYILRKYWQYLTSTIIMTITIIVFYYLFQQLLFPSLLVIISSILISILLGLKFFRSPTFKSRILVTDVQINNAWRLNHWGGNVAQIIKDKMIFTGTTAPKGQDGSHIDLGGQLEIGKAYEISCFAKSFKNTNGKFQLWCHDQINNEPTGEHEASPYKTPSTKGETISLKFKASYNQNIRIHLQYSPGVGQIDVSKVQIYELTT